MDRILIGRCGKFCGECEVYLAAHAHDPEPAKKLAAERGVKPGAVKCEGCQGPAENRYDPACKIALCLDDRGYRYCAQCAEINDCTKYAQNNAKCGGRPRIYSTQLKAWGEERWLRFHLGEETEDEE